MDLTTRVSLVQNLLTTKEIPASVGAKLLDINRTSIYYKTSPVSDEELACKEIIDHLHTDNPTWGARQMSAQLKNRGYHVGRRKARRYMNEMDIYPIYPKMNLSKRVQQAKVCPYLLRNAVIDAPNQAFLLCEVMVFYTQKDPAFSTQGLISFFILFYFLINFPFPTGR